MKRKILSIPSSVHLAMGRRRRRDDAVFIAIGVLLVFFFLVQFAWAIVHQAHP